MAGWVTIVGSAAVVLTVFDLIANLRSIDTRERVQKAVSEPPLDGMGVDVQQVLTVMHVLALVAAGCATAAAILGWHVLRRNKSARLWLTVLAVPLFVAGLVTGGFMSSMVAVAVIMLWTRPSRDWFDGRSPARAGGYPARTPEPPADRSTDRSTPEPPPPTQPTSPAAYPGFGSRPDTPAPQADQQAPAPWSPPAQQPPGTPYVTARPREVVLACVVTWVVAGLVVLAMALVLISFSADPTLIDDVYSSDDRFADSGLSADQIRSFSLGLALAFGLWALAATALAVLVLLGRNWARYALIGSAGMTALVSVLMVVAAPVILLLTFAAIATVVLLTRPAVNAWFGQRGRIAP
jgi:hypothetical protein